MSRRFQFSLRTLLVAACLIGPAALLLRWLVHRGLPELPFGLFVVAAVFAAQSAALMVLDLWPRK